MNLPVLAIATIWGLVFWLLLFLFAWRLPGPKRRIYLEALAHANGQNAVTRCALCRWKYEGLVETGKHLFEFHMRDIHGRKVKRKR